MLNQSFIEAKLPAWMRPSHPLVRYQVHKSAPVGMQYVVFGSTIGLFLLFGGLSLPILYLFIWLLMLMQQAVTMALRIHDAQVKQSWDLLRMTPYSPREVLLATWAGNFWQINQSWMMRIYRLLQGTAVIGVIVFGLWFAEFPPHQAVLVLTAGAAAILLQPIIEVYCSGMIGLLCARLFPHQAGATGLAAAAMLLYWCACVAFVLVVVFADQDGVSLEQLLIALTLPTLLPAGLGYAALRVVEGKIEFK